MMGQEGQLQIIMPFKPLTMVVRIMVPITVDIEVPYDFTRINREDEFRDMVIEAAARDLRNNELAVDINSAESFTVLTEGYQEE